MMNSKLSFDSSSMMTSSSMSSSSSFSAQKLSAQFSNRQQMSMQKSALLREFSNNDFNDLRISENNFSFPNMNNELKLSDDKFLFANMQESHSSHVQQASVRRVVQQKVRKIRKTRRIVNGEVVEEEEVVDEIEGEPQIDQFSTNKAIDFSQRMFATLDNNGKLNSDFKNFRDFNLASKKGIFPVSKSLEMLGPSTQTPSKLKAIEPPPASTENKSSKILKALGFNKTKDHGRIDLIISELMKTEENYVKDLCWLVENYMTELNRPDAPDELKGDGMYMLFGNIEIIYMFHDVQFLPGLRECEKTPDEIAKCFLKNKREFYLYRHYNRNKPYTEGYLQKYGSFFKERQTLLEDNLDLSSYLIKPTQRLGKYILLMKDLAKDCKKHKIPSTNITEAVDMLEAEMRLGNDLMALDAIKGCDLDLKGQGDLIYRDKFTIWPDVGSKYEAMVFLFAELMLFTNIKLEKNVDVLNYKDNIKLKDIGLTECAKEPKIFKVWFRKHTEKHYKLQAKCEKTKEMWVKEIRKQLEKELQLAKTRTNSKPVSFIDLGQMKYLDTAKLKNKDS